MMNAFVMAEPHKDGSDRGANLSSGASPPARATAGSPKDGSQCPECLIYGFAIRKHVEHIAIDHHDVGAARVAGRGYATDGP
jgi:hypothetical protein